MPSWQTRSDDVLRGLVQRLRAPPWSHKNAVLCVLRLSGIRRLWMEAVSTQLSTDSRVRPLADQVRMLGWERHTQRLGAQTTAIVRVADGTSWEDAFDAAAVDWNASTWQHTAAVDWSSDAMPYFMRRGSLDICAATCTNAMAELRSSVTSPKIGSKLLTQPLRLERWHLFTAGTGPTSGAARAPLSLIAHRIRVLHHNRKWTDEPDFGFSTRGWPPPASGQALPPP